MARHIRWGILGAAKFAREYMGPAIHAARGGTLAALATSGSAKIAPFAAFAPGLRHHTGYDALLDDPEIDAVYIPLPNHIHVEWTKKALAAGKAVLCEKPIAMKAEEIDDLIALRDANRLLASEAWMIAHHPQWHRVRNLISSGAIGDLLRVDGNFTFNNPDPDNIRNQAGTGGGALRDIGVYILGGARLATGKEPERIIAAQIDWQAGIDATAHVLAQFPGFVFKGTVSMRAAPWQEMQFHGTEGHIRMPVPFNAQVYGEARVELQRGQHVETWRYPAANHYVLQVEAFNDTLLRGVPWPLPLEFSRGTQAMMDAVYAAAG
ncbi:Gfo/Idh/MocA family oxidoreductase [Thalassococcus sp. CAU 1522]|uniref:Gfo/Idh/MocA family oxidoreductase n=1 Tax=Thalassococcus arenae TaxID=2851652 RepID=A0ABS6N9D5_9RHOB|nr:Gfo/Idh/MocA family oxidoreductase [Thalassococcus arenae]MBV2360418.1 Gfo/Idh/MocA family oxidoreductase [Thalassococcus arenae]